MMHRAPHPVPDPAAAARLATQARLVAALAQTLARDATAGSVRTIETHISYVLLTGTFAFKVKKAVDLGFVDYATLERRRRFCEEELRLNRRLAPAIYLDVVPVTGSIDAPVLAGHGPVLDYAVRMREFPQDALLSSLADRDALPPASIDTLADVVADFHRRIPAAAAHSAHGAPGPILQQAIDNLDACDALAAPAERAMLARLRAWTRSAFGALRPLLAERRLEGCVRECHGDLHLRNVAMIDGAPVMFDGIEFSEPLRWIDVVSDVAFLAMDLVHRGRRDLAFRFLNRYLERTGDYRGVAVLRFYLVYRALVRAKIGYLRARQSGARAGAEAADAAGHVHLAQREAFERNGALVAMCGPSGTGKSALSERLAALAPAIRVRTDVERKRLFGVPQRGRPRTGIAAGLYSSNATRETYRKAADGARTIVEAGYTAIVDGTFLRRWQRDLARELAQTLGVPFAVVRLEVPVDTLRQRVAARSRAGDDASDADLAVLEHQLGRIDSIGPDEQAFVVDVDGRRALADPAPVLAALTARLGSAAPAERPLPAPRAAAPGR